MNPNVLNRLRQLKRRILKRIENRPGSFFDEAVIDADGTLVGTGGCCKEGIDSAYDGTWGYHPMVVSLANTAEPLFLVNRSGNRLATDKGQMRLFDEYRYFFFITNDRMLTAEEVVLTAKGRCNQENLISQLKSGVYALTAPVDNLMSN